MSYAIRPHARLVAAAMVCGTAAIAAGAGYVVAHSSVRKQASRWQMPAAAQVAVVGQAPTTVAVPLDVRAPAVASQGRDGPPVPTYRPIPSPEEAKRITDERIASAIAAHESEPLDRRWSHDAEASFGQDLQTLAGKAGFEVLSLDCRSTSCLAGLKWKDDRPGTKEDLMGILSYSFAYNCVRTVFPTPGGTPLKDMTAAFDCKGVPPPQ